jgi:hypothetical protein
MSDLLPLAAITSEHEARVRVVTALSVAGEMLEEDGHPLCVCQRIALLAALENACAGFALSVMVGTLSADHEGLLGAFDLGPSLAEFHLSGEGLDPFMGNGEQSVAVADGYLGGAA